MDALERARFIAVICCIVLGAALCIEFCTGCATSATQVTLEDGTQVTVVRNSLLRKGPYTTTVVVPRENGAPVAVTVTGNDEAISGNLAILGMAAGAAVGGPPGAAVGGVGGAVAEVIGGTFKDGL
jgi:hypothetical protein